MWVDVTWGAGGSTADKTLEICINALKVHGLNVMMHLTCTNMPKESLKDALNTCKENGIRNILALRGDPPGHLEKGAESEGFKQCEGGFAYATDLVKYIRAEFGDYFCVAVAGYPEGHLEAVSFDDDMKHLKEKVEAGSDLIVTQLFYDNPSFLEYVDKCKAMGITIPILPGHEGGQVRRLRQQDRGEKGREEDPEGGAQEDQEARRRAAQKGHGGLDRRGGREGGLRPQR